MCYDTLRGQSKECWSSMQVSDKSYQSREGEHSVFTNGMVRSGIGVFDIPFHNYCIKINYEKVLVNKADEYYGTLSTT